jgi:glycopeptide antibiotics resistance protein
MNKFRAAAVVFLAYLLLLFYLTLMSPVYNSIHSINIVPLKSIMALIGSSGRVILRNIAGNIAAFLPMGLLLPLLCKRLDRLRIIIVISGALSIFIEILQYILNRRVTDIDDVILNIIGGITGYIIYILSVRCLVNLKYCKNRCKKSGTGI